MISGLVNHYCKAAQVIRTFSGLTMGTNYYVKVLEPEFAADWQQVEKDICTILNEVESKVSSYKKDSEISRFNQSRQLTWIEVSSETAKIVAKALEISQASEGSFDITVGPLVNLWGASTPAASVSEPMERDIKNLLANIGHNKLAIRLSPPSLRKSHPDLTIDLASIIKGYGIDRISEYLLSKKLNNFMVEIGGEIRTSGLRQDGRHWQVAIEKPLKQSENKSIQRVVSIHNQAVTTSGDFRNHLIRGSKQVKIIDPRDGHPISHNLVSVTVIDTSGVDSDAWATALLVLGPKKGMEIATKQKKAVLFLVKNGESWTEILSPQFIDQFVQKKFEP